MTPHGPILLDPCPEGTWATCLDTRHIATTTLARTREAEREFLHAHQVQPDPDQPAEVPGEGLLL